MAEEMNNEKQTVICVIPVFNDWESLEILLTQIRTINSAQFNVSAVVVDDCSTEPQPAANAGLPLEFLHLKVNVGHQRAIATGLQYIASEHPGTDYVVVMDADGEDRPEDIPKLIRKCAETGNSKIVFARRKKRHATIFFKAGYFFYRMIFFILTGQRIGFGNFSCVPAALLHKLVGLENLWVHYSGCVLQGRLPWDSLRLDRGRRFRGKSKMNSNSLILHGLVAISVYFDSMSVRILKATLGGFAICAGAVLLVLYYKLFTSLAIPGWASNLILILLSIIVQLAAVTLIVLLMQLSSRKNVRIPDTRVTANLWKRSLC